MDESLRPLLDAAFLRGPALEANAKVRQAREEFGGESARGYEVVVPPDGSAGWFCESVLPRLVYHMESLGSRPPQAAGFFLSLFVGEEVVFVRARDAFRFAAEVTGLTSDQMLARWGTQELRGPVEPDQGKKVESRPLPGLPERT